MKRNRKNRRSLTDKILFVLCVVVVILLILLIGLLVSVLKDTGEEEPMIEEEITWIPEEASTEESTQEESSEEESSTYEVEIVYPEPEYDFTLEEITVEVPGVEQEYTLAWVSDLHMITNQEAAEDVMPEYVETLVGRYAFFKTADGVYSDQLWPEIVKFLNFEKFDGVIFGGDMLDYYSESNRQKFMEEYVKLRSDVPVLYIRADHDYEYNYGGEALPETKTHELHTTIDGDDLNDKYLDFGEFSIIGVNGSTKDMSAHQYDIISKQYERGRPVLIATHVPYESQYDVTEDNSPIGFVSLEEHSMNVKNKVYYWTYFSQQGQYVPNEVTKKYLEQVYASDTLVCQVLAGHVHAKWDGMISEKVRQHIFTPAYEGVIGIVHIVPQAE